MCRLWKLRMNAIERWIRYSRSTNANEVFIAFY
jgi:hypothetical protein